MEPEVEKAFGDEGLIKDNYDKWCWKTRRGELIRVTDMADSHLRNSALFLMGMGYSLCIASDEARIFWLTILRIEWERRMTKQAVENTKYEWKGQE